MADEKKPIPFRGHNYARILTAAELWLITRKKQTVLGRIVKPDEARKAIEEKFNIHSF